MSAQQLLVITADSGRFDSLHYKFQNCMHAGMSLNISFTPNVSAAKVYRSKNHVDLILLDVDSNGLSEPLQILPIVHTFAPIPLVAWLEKQCLDRAPELTAQGVVACLDESMMSSHLIQQVFDIIVQNARALQLRDQRLQEITVTLEAIADGVICTNSRAEITFANSAAQRLLNFPPYELAGCSVSKYMELKDPHSRELITHPVHQAIAHMQAGRLRSGTILARHDHSEIRIEDSCSPVIDASGSLQGVVMVFHDITEAYEMQAQIDHLAWHDFLTGLPNRFTIAKHLDNALAHAASHHQQVPVLYIDLDKFKLVNDTMGHGAGDKLLVMVAERLRTCFRLIDLVGRQGGDEFVVVMAPGSKCEEAVLAGARILETLSKSYQIDGSEILTGCSVC